VSEHEREFEGKLGDAERSFVAFVAFPDGVDNSSTEAVIDELDEKLEEPGPDGVGVSIYCDNPEPALTPEEQIMVNQAAIAAYWETCQSAHEAAGGA
jgi:hypothetical protein